jgi:tetratricopeptide (TPR) repeat protein
VLSQWQACSLSHSDEAGINLTLIVVLKRYAGTGRFDEAIQQYRKTLDHSSLGDVYFAQHKYRQAFAEWKEFAADTGDPDVINRYNAVWKTFQTSGHLVAMRTLAELQIQASTYIPPSVIASDYFAAGERERGFAWLERAYKERDDSLEGIRIDPAVAPFRSDPRYADLLRRYVGGPTRKAIRCLGSLSLICS